MDLTEIQLCDFGKSHDSDSLAHCESTVAKDLTNVSHPLLSSHTPHHWVWSRKQTYTLAKHKDKRAGSDGDLVSDRSSTGSEEEGAVGGCDSDDVSVSARSTVSDISGYARLNSHSDSASLGSFSTNSSPAFSRRSPCVGPFHKLVHEGDLMVCRLVHPKTIISKILNSKYLRRWEWHRITLGTDELTSAMRFGYLAKSIKYSEILGISEVSRWDSGHKFCLRISLEDGSLLLQANNAHLRDQLLHSLRWKRQMFVSEQLMKNARRPERLLDEMDNLVRQALTCRIQDESICQFPLDLVSQLLPLKEDFLCSDDHVKIIETLQPLLENINPRQEICDFFIKFCRTNPRSPALEELFTPIVQRMLKHYTDFGRYPRNRMFVAEYLLAMHSQNCGDELVTKFVQDMHRPVPSCPHPRVLPNLVAVALASVYSLYEQRKQWNNVHDKNIIAERNRSIVMDTGIQCVAEWESKVLCFCSIMSTIVGYEDWRAQMAALVQPIPFPDAALQDPLFTANMRPVIRAIAEDERCDVHQCLLAIREGKEGWFQVYCPGYPACDDEGQLFGLMLKTLIGCCCRRKRFLESMMKIIGPCMLLAIRDNVAAMDTLCSFLELDIVESGDMQLQIITALQSTTVGKRFYAQLCERQIAVRELQQQGGPRKLTLPSKSTDADLSKLLSSGSFGNLECLSLAFTRVTSACAHDLIKLRSLRYLNLWSTQFGDTGLQLISDHLPRLQVLNLCETPVTDKGLSCLTGMKNLRKLNLNSTGLTALTFEGLKEKLPCLQECDVRYTDAF